jgi:hypothetical protein
VTDFHTNNTAFCPKSNLLLYDKCSNKILPNNKPLLFDKSSPIINKGTSALVHVGIISS